FTSVPAASSRALHGDVLIYPTLAFRFTIHQSALEIVRIWSVARDSTLLEQIVSFVVPILAETIATACGLRSGQILRQYSENLSSGNRRSCSGNR
ncbi:hypothetical protein PENTCL1PPCAC_9150, partial [Pristionchus entomophagus]